MEDKYQNEIGRLNDLMNENVDLLKQINELNGRMNILCSEMSNEKESLMEIRNSNRNLEQEIARVQEERRELEMENERLRTTNRDQQRDIERNGVRTEDTLSSLYVMTWQVNGHAVYYMTVRQNYLPQGITEANVYYHALYPAPMEIKKELHDYVDAANMPLLQNYAYITNIRAVMDMLINFYKPVRIIIDPRNQTNEEN